MTGLCVCLFTEATIKHSYKPQEQSNNQKPEKERYGDSERQASILVPHNAGEIDGCIQDFYTPLIGFTGH